MVVDLIFICIAMRFMNENGLTNIYMIFLSHLMAPSIDKVGESDEDN
jgi:uncharacterized membrane protein YgaE (UPF0421/DUF939 family)